MNTRWRVLLPMAVVLPLAAYVAGALVQATGDEPPAREPLVLIDEKEPQDPRDKPRPRGDDEETEGPVVTPDPVEDDDDDSRTGGADDGDDAPGERGGDDGEADDDDDGGDD